MKILQVTASSVSALLIIAVMIGSAGATPLLSVGSNANYQLKASIQSTQNCTATPVTYNQTACGPNQPMVLVNIYDNGNCASNSSSCYFSPSYFYYPLLLGTTVMWFNYGSLDHKVTSVNGPGLQPFTSPTLGHYGSYSVTFNTPGNYSYYDSLNPSMRGNFIISNTLPAAPPVSSYNPMISLDGSVDWTVIGLDNNVAVLNVSHTVNIVASSGALSFTPVTETGSLSQSIDLATRVESSGTATSMILGIIQRMLAYYPYLGYYGYPTAFGQLLSSQKPIYTFWWVNGPLASGAPVQILTGHSSVAGSEAVNLGPSNNRNAWIVESTLSQSLTVNSLPTASTASSFSTFKLDLRFDYDQLSDLLLKSSAVISSASTQVQGYKPGDALCGPSGCFPVSDVVTVTHHMSFSLPISLQLTSTSLDLSKRMPAGSTGESSGASNLPSTMSLLFYTGIGLAGAGIVGTTAWLLRRRARLGSPVAPNPAPMTSPPTSG